MRAALALLVCLVCAAGLRAQDDAIPLSADQVADRWHGRLDGRHFFARVELEMDLAGLRERRTLRVWRDDGGSQDERLLVRFDEPADLRDVGLLYLEHSDRPNDYFLYQPSTRRVRRLPVSIADDDIYGIDLEFLGFGVAQTEPTEILSMTRERVSGRDAYRLSERALEKNPRFDQRTTWIDASNFVAVRSEHVREGDVVLIAEVLEIDTLDGVPTPVRMSFRRTSGDRTVELRVASVDYTAAIPEQYFSALALVRKLAGE
jgi:hypothetical protein